MLTIVALYNFDNSILDSIYLPEGFDREVVQTAILRECSELTLVYSEPSILKVMLANWSERRAPVWERLLKTTQYEYNPIHNYDRMEQTSDNIVETGSDVGTVQGFDSNSFEPRDSQDSSSSTAVNHVSHMSGNIGVTTTQQMIEAERQVSRFDPVSEIVSDFKHEFCILVY